MKHTETVTINAPANRVWPFLADPVLQAAWNPKIISVDRPADGPLQTGDEYNLVVKMSRSGKESTSHAEVLDVVPGERLVTRHRADKDHGIQMATEIYELHERNNIARVTQTIDLSENEFHWLLRPLLKFVMKHGKTKGEPQLHGLKRLVESEVGA